MTHRSKGQQAIYKSQSRRATNKARRAKTEAAKRARKHQKLAKRSARA